MEVGRRRGNSTRNGVVVVSGSVWETRMKSDQVKGGIKVFNGEEEVFEEHGVHVHRKFRVSQSGGKRKTWKSETGSVRSQSVDGVVRDLCLNLNSKSKSKSKSKSTLGFENKVKLGFENQVLGEIGEGNSGEFRKTVSDSNRVLDDSGELGKAISDSNKVLGECVEGNLRELRMAISDSSKILGGFGEGNSGELRKAISDSNKVLGECVEEIESNLVELRGVKKQNLDELEKVGLGLGLSEVVVDGIEKNSIEVKGLKSDSCEVFDDSRGIEDDPSQFRKLECDGDEVLDDLVKGFDESCSGVEKKQAQLRKLKCDVNEVLGDVVKNFDESGSGVEKKQVQLRKSKWDSNKISDNSGNDVDAVVDRIDKSSIQFKNSKWDANKVDSMRNLCKSVDGIEKSPVQCRRLKWDSNNSMNGIEKNPIQFKDFGVSKDKIISQIKCAPKPEVPHEEEDEDDEEYEEMDDEIGVEIEKKRIEIKEINVAEEKPKKILNDVKKIHQISEKRAPIASSVVRKQISPIINHSIKTSIPTKATPISVSYEYQRVPETHSRLQHLVDLIMWRDVSRSAFVFGIGTFFMLSSSYTNDLNVSFISVISYLGLVYLAAVFIYKSLICRGAVDLDVPSGDFMFGEEEAVWLLKLVLPCLNEFLLKIKGLFSGDPATTMKLAVLLFVLARCGSSITIWKMTKLGFFGVFTVPKVCSSYSSQLTDYGKFWIRRFRDAWETCAHKKAVAAAIFTLVWNLSSIVARIWAVFVLFVAVRYYQQSMIKDEWTVEDEAAVSEESLRVQSGGRRLHGGSSLAKERKGC